MKAKDIMTRNVITVRADDTIENVTNLLLEHDISGVPVVDDEKKVIGIVSETDLIYKDKNIDIPAYFPFLGGYILLESMKKFEKQLKKMAGYKVKDIMSEKVITINESKEIREVVNTMLNNNINRIPVVNDDEKVVGIIARSDVLRNI
ncbi:MAG: CBS domain-containing protein [Firmicutes bacterium]|nr:CBS domain-containing protein [Bacillota bacterium]